ncbi:MAG: tetratricopeptide repeat protein [Burkholderiaceae bacterium]
MSDPSPVTFVFTDIEGSTRLWEHDPERMLPVMAHHDTVSRAAVERHRGTVVKMTGDGVHAAFDSPIDAVLASIEIQQRLSSSESEHGMALPLRCGLHTGIDERRDGDFYGRAVNRAARIMCAAHGGQILLSRAVAEQIGATPPPDVSLRDLGSVRLRDLSSPEHIYQLLHPQLRADFPALRSLEGTPNNLTQQLNSFIGRERELTEVRQLLMSNRLVTLLGMGGIGKSRLSLQLAADVLDDFPDGVWFVELAALTDPDAVPQAVASVLGVKEEAGRPVVEALIKYVRDLQLLIILDNCEQVVHGCADLAKRLLQAGSRIKILTSSRDYLQVAGETAYHVPTLSVPDAQQSIDIESMIRHEAVRLFVDRASAARQGFSLNKKNAASVVDICRRLDGIPLAIELAAARIRALSPEAIAARLHDRFRLLVTGDQTVLPRQRTLRALIDWSYDLLTEAERTLFQRLSVFAGGWTLEAAEAVCADAELLKADVLDLLTCLVEKSLVVTDVGGDRYRMLDTVRHYAQEKLDAANDAAAVRNRHLQFFLALAEQARAEFGSPTHESALARLDVDRENLLSAHRWIDSAKSASEDGLRLASALKSYWINRGLLEQGYRVTAEALGRIDSQRRDFARCRGLFDAGQLCCFMGRHAQAQQYLKESLTIAREIGDQARIVSVLQPLGMAAVGLGDLDNARAYGEEAVSLARGLGKRRELAVALISLAQLHRMEGQLTNAEPLYESALSLFRELGDQEATAIGLLNLAMVSIDQANGEHARPMLSEALAIAVRMGSRQVGVSALEVTAALCAFCRDCETAAKLFGAAEAQAEQAGLRRDAVDDAFLARLMLRAKTELCPPRFEATARIGRSMPYEEALALAHARLQNESEAADRLNVAYDVRV